MAGLKRPRTEELAKHTINSTKAKKLKSEPSKAEAKYALKLARGSKKSAKVTVEKVDSSALVLDVDVDREEKDGEEAQVGALKNGGAEDLRGGVGGDLEGEGVVRGGALKKGIGKENKKAKGREKLVEKADLDELEKSESENGFNGFSTEEDGDSVETIPAAAAKNSDKPVKKSKVESTEKSETKSKREKKDKAKADDKASVQSKGQPKVEFKDKTKADGKMNVKPNGHAAIEGGPLTNGGSNSKESHVKQKALAKERKALKPNADEIQRTLKIWERLRMKSHVPKDERAKLLGELFEIITGRVKDFVFKHDAVRAVQCALKYATMSQRHMIAEELKGSYKDLAESRYAKFLIGKMLVEGDNQIRDLIIPEFYGHVRRMINHPEASWILDDIYRSVASKVQKSRLLREWYGPEFVLFNSAGETAALSDILANAPEKRKPVMDYLHNLINQLIQKKLTGFTMLHDAMLQYFLNISAGSSEMSDFLKLIIGDQKEEEVDLLKNLAFTKPGSRVVCLALAHGTAKDRKLILRAYNETVSLLAVDPNGHIILVAAYEVIDDTRETIRRVFSELVSLTKEATTDAQAEKIIPLTNDLVGRIPLLYPFAGAAKWLINKLETQDRIAEITTIRTTTSKKAPETRKSELITALSPIFLSTIATHAATLIKTPFGCQFISEILLKSTGNKSAALSAVADLAIGDPTADDHVAKSRTVGRMFKTLIAGGHFDGATKKVDVCDAELGFHRALYQRIRSEIVGWACGESSFVAVALAEADGFEMRGEMLRVLRGARAELEGAASTTSAADTTATATASTQRKVGGESDVDGGFAEAKVNAKGKKRKSLNADGKDGKDEAGSVARVNAGAKILLTMLDA